jgi:hypothetical protein
MKWNRSCGEKMKCFMTVLLAAFIMLLATAAPVVADEDEGNEANENEADSEEESAPGFEVAFAGVASLAVARLLKARIL